MGTQQSSGGSPSRPRPGDLSPASVQPARVVSEAGPEVSASWKRGCQSRGVAASARGPVTPSPPVTFTKRTPAGVHSGWPRRVSRGVGTGPPTPGQTRASRKYDCSQRLLSGSAWLKSQNPGPGGGGKKGASRRQQGDGPPFSRPLPCHGVQARPLQARSQGMFENLPSPSRSSQL